MNFTVYLAGAITGISYKQATLWRNIAEAYLKANNFTVLSPMRDKTALKDIECLENTYEKVENCSAEEIFKADLNDVSDSDIILVNLYNLKGVGTQFELGYAFALDKEIVIVAPPELITHPFVSESAKGSCFLTLEEGLNYITENYNSEAFKEVRKKSEVFKDMNYSPKDKWEKDKSKEVFDSLETKDEEGTEKSTCISGYDWNEDFWKEVGDQVKKTDTDKTSTKKCSEALTKLLSSYQTPNIDRMIDLQKKAIERKLYFKFFPGSTYT